MHNILLIAKFYWEPPKFCILLLQKKKQPNFTSTELEILLMELEKQKDVLYGSFNKSKYYFIKYTELGSNYFNFFMLNFWVFLYC